MKVPPLSTRTREIRWNIGTTSMPKKLSHYDEHGQTRMIDVSQKQKTAREAEASAFVRMSSAVLRALPDNPKGDPLEVARTAGIMAHPDGRRAIRGARREAAWFGSALELPGAAIGAAAAASTVPPAAATAHTAGQPCANAITVPVGQDTYFRCGSAWYREAYGPAGPTFVAVGSPGQ